MRKLAVAGLVGPHPRIVTPLGWRVAKASSGPQAGSTQLHVRYPKYELTLLHLLHTPEFMPSASRPPAAWGVSPHQPAFFADVLAGLLEGVAHMHSRGVVHADLKLENIMINASR